MGPGFGLIFVLSFRGPRLDHLLTILLVHFPYSPGVSSFQDHIVVELIPMTRGGKLWSWNFGKRIKIHAVDVQANNVEDGRDGKQLKQGRQLHG